MFPARLDPLCEVEREYLCLEGVEFCFGGLAQLAGFEMMGRLGSSE